MSLMNRLLGVHPHFELLLAAVGLTTDELPRFRDVWIEDPSIVKIMTRVGGGNREAYEAQIQALQAKPNYITDYDDERDSTYAVFDFNPLKGHEDVVAGVFRQTEDKRSPMEKFFALVEKLKDPTSKDDPLVKNAMNVGKEILGPIFGAVQAAERGENGPTVTIVKV